MAQIVSVRQTLSTRDRIFESHQGVRAEPTLETGDDEVRLRRKDVQSIEVAGHEEAGVDRE